MKMISKAARQHLHKHIASTGNFRIFGRVSGTIGNWARQLNQAHAEEERLYAHAAEPKYKTACERNRR